ncbi:recombinase family protein [Dietzia sp. ANT_WB102]|uniref:recombinase family protein n=1 Tax=Dietzia sp. ANT_WB102 TaxID=2597345 RepID=UPI0011EE742F|nr:recombinase family protein [Dietzia sp. ANT_WB102]KAA0916999.1 recombinase family protein [Dietzia sp. ANT_WB102]
MTSSPAPAGPLRAVIYTRVSQDPSGGGRSVTSQETECRTYCERQGWPVAEVVTDNDRGASRWSGADRPGYRRLADLLQPGDVLVTWEASRAQRDLAAYVALRDLCADREVFWSYSGRTYDLNTGDARFSTGLDALLAEREAELIRERVLRGKRAAAKEGRPAGRPPYGYRPVKDARTGKTLAWEPDPDQAPVVQEIVARVLAGESLWAVVRDLDRREIPAPDTQRNAAGSWRPQRLRVMLSSASYAGKRTHQGEIIGDGAWPALVALEDWERLQIILTDPSRNVGPGPEPKHLLSGLAVCGLCGSPVRYFGPKSVKSPRYLCEKNCVGRRAELVDQLVTAVVLARLSRPDAAVALTPRGGNDDQAAARDEVRTLTARLEDFTEAAASGSISATAFARIEASITAQLDQAQARLKAATAGGVSPTVATLATAADPAQVWEGLDIRARREVVKTLVNVTINKSTGGTRRFIPEDVVITWKTGADHE